MSSRANTLENGRDRGQVSLGHGGVPLVIAHRGAAADAPENTLEAFELAWRQGADGVEFDVHLSSDGVPVVIHDPCLERTTSGRGRVRDHSVSALRTLDAGSWFNERYCSKARPGYQGLRIPLLSEALDWVRKRGCRAFVEIKGGQDACPGVETKVVAEISHAGVRSQATVISFDLATLQRCRHVDRRIALGIDFSRPFRALEKARSVSALYLHPHWLFVSPRFLDCAHRAGIQVLAWGLDVEAPMRRMMTRGVDGLMTDYPGCAVRLRAELRASPLSASA